MTEPDKPYEPMSAQERLDLGRSYYNEDKFDEAIAKWSKITRDDGSELYAWAQFNIGNIWNNIGNLDEAIAAWSNVRRSDNLGAYAWAQFNVGLAYQAQNKLNEAIRVWSKIHRKDNRKTYAEAQFNLGVAYHAQGKLEQAIKTWSKVHYSDNSEACADAQFNLGVAYHILSEQAQAIIAWSNIHRDDNPQAYAKAQFNLGVAYHILGEQAQAIIAWSNVPCGDNSGIYAWAQFHLGNTYKDLGEQAQAIIAWSNVPCGGDNSEAYARAQFNLGVAYHAQGKLDKAITAWSNVRHSNDPEASYKDSKKPDEAITWLKVDSNHSPEVYFEAQLCLGKVYSLDKEKEEHARKAYENVRGVSYYKSERGFKILKCPGGVRKDLHSLAENTDIVLKSLQMIPEFESKVAHYSRPSTAFKLFGDEKNNKNPSNFRLNTIRGVNDPTEGLVLRDYWKQQGIPETIHTSDNATFISCFTFNHDSLNQFRLYGKEKGREATGVSLVFNKEFFSDQSDTLEYIVDTSSDPSNKFGENKSDEAEKPESNNKKLPIDKTTLYRCIYLDPETGYWNLAQRDKSTFYRDGKRKAEEEWEKYQTLVKEKGGNIERYLFTTFYRKYKEKIDKEWEKYQTLTQEKKENFKKYLFNDDISILHLLEKIFPKYSSYTEEEKQQVLETVRFILLPLQYLVKHIAFQEEQECRIMYITQSSDEKIHSNCEEQQMYVEYEEPVLPHIDKIYLSRGAEKHKGDFCILLDQDGNKSKVRISQNPFRNKE